MTDILSTLTSIKSQIAAIEQMLASGTVEEAKKRGRPLKEKAAKEPRPPREMSEGVKAWIEFNKRISALFKDTENAFKRVAVAKKFASYLKKLKAVDEWTDEEIRTHRSSWVEDSVETNVTALSETDMSSIEGPVKRAGRPKMTDEEKAAAKAARDAKKLEIPEMVTIPEIPARLASPKKASKIGSAPGAPKKVGGKTVAWSEGDAKNLMEEAAEFMNVPE